MNKNRFEFERRKNWGKRSENQIKIYNKKWNEKKNHRTMERHLSCSCSFFLYFFKHVFVFIVSLHGYKKRLRSDLFRFTCRIRAWVSVFVCLPAWPPAYKWEFVIFISFTYKFDKCFEFISNRIVMCILVWVICTAESG